MNDSVARAGSRSVKSSVSPELRSVTVTVLRWAVVSWISLSPGPPVMVSAPPPE